MDEEEAAEEEAKQRVPAPIIIEIWMKAEKGREEKEKEKREREEKRGRETRAQRSVETARGLLEWRVVGWGGGGGVRAAA